MSFHSRKLFLSKVMTGLSDAYFNYVTLLLHGNGTSSGTNNTFIDNGPATEGIAKSGTVGQGSMSPYNINWSNYFEGNSILTTPSDPAFAMGTGDFTVEAWIYITGNLAGDFSIFSTRTDTAQDSSQFVLSVGTNQKLRYASLVVLDSSSVVKLNKWVHVACVRTSGSVSLFLNGQLETTFIDADAKTKQIASIGANCITAGSVIQGMQGYISNLRVVKSSLYTSNFTPSTSNLTAIAGTSLLTCQSNRWIDNSVNNFTLASSGSVAAFIYQFSPFQQPSAYSIINNGGSVEFLTPAESGTVYLANGNGRFNFTSGTFTIEFWLYSTKQPTSNSTIISSTLDLSGWSIGVDSTNQINIRLNGIASAINMTAPISYGQWNHIAVSGVTGSYALFVNGKIKSIYTGTTNLFSNSPVRISGRSNNPSIERLHEARISNLRITQTQVYNADFSVPTFPVSSTGNGGALPSTIPPNTATSIPLMLDFTNGQIFDNSTKNNLASMNLARISTVTKKFGTGSISFPTTSSSRLINYDRSVGSPFNYGSGDFTIELWFYLGFLAPIGTGYIINHTLGASISVAIRLNSSSRIELILEDVLVGTSVNPVPLNTWIHIALVRSGSGITLFVNGTSVITGSTSVTTLGGGITAINGLYNNSAYANVCFMDDVRITKGIARYLTNFAPPTTQFPDF
jgi:hypothetical protein